MLVMAEATFFGFEASKADERTEVGAHEALTGNIFVEPCGDLKVMI